MRIFILALLMVVLGVSAADAAERKPNIIVMLADDLGWRDLSCFGSTFYETPNLDGLAKRGMRFTQAYSACQVCSPTRAAVLTGKYPPRVQVTDFIGGPQPDKKYRRNTRMLPAPYLEHLPKETTTLAESLKAAGYVTIHAGKWHLGGEEQNSLPTDHGFDVNIAGTHRGGPYGRGKYLHPFDLPNLDSKEGDHLPIRLAEEAIKQMKKAHAEGKPFFLYHAFYSVHTPLVTTDALKAKYEAKARTVTHDGPDWIPDGARDVRQVQDHAVYGGMIEGMDTAAGMLMRALREMGVEDNTIVMFTADNGGLSTSEGSPTSNVPLRAGKGWMYEGGIRVPLIISWPGVTAPGSESNVPVISMDYFPTMAAAAGADPGNVDGVNLRPVLGGDGPLPRRDLYWHYPHYGNQGGQPSGAIREGDWKLVELFDAGRTELYNIAADLSEQNNLAAEYPERVEAMRAKLRAWREEVGAKMATENPKFDPSKKIYE